MKQPERQTLNLRRIGINKVGIPIFAPQPGPARVKPSSALKSRRPRSSSRVPAAKIAFLLASLEKPLQ